MVGCTLIRAFDTFDARYTENHNVLFEGRHVGRIYKAISHAPREAPWFWGLEFHEWQGSDGPQSVWECRDARSCKARLPRRVGSQAEGERKKLGVAHQFARVRLS